MGGKKHEKRCILLPSSIFLSIRIFSNESALRIRWPKHWSFSFSFSISLSNEYSGLIPFRTDGFDLLAVQGSLKSLLQHHSSKASTLQCSAFFMVQFSHPYMTIGKTIALTIWIFDSKVMSLLFNMLSRFVIAFLPRSKCIFKFHGCSHHPLWQAKRKAFPLPEKVSGSFESAFHMSRSIRWRQKHFLILYARHWALGRIHSYGIIGKLLYFSGPQFLHL